MALIKDGAVWRDGPPAQVIDAAVVKEVYGAEVVVVANPVTGGPAVFVTGNAKDHQGTK